MNVPCSWRLGPDLSGIPHADLSIQFDVCQEVLLFENYFPVREPDYKETCLRAARPLAASVPNAASSLDFTSVTVRRETSRCCD